MGDPHGRAGLAWRQDGEPDLLASCYRESFARAAEVGAKTVAFPAISTGVFGYPVRDAASIAVRTVKESANVVEAVRFVCFDDETYAAYEAELSAA